MIKLKYKYEGLLFVGDPHLWSKCPGRRKDASFMETVLNKINQAVSIALEKNLYLVILGDLFHDDADNDTLMIVQLIKILQRLPEPPVTIVGNHEKSQKVLTDDVAISILRAANILYTIDKNDIWGEIDIGGEVMYIGGTPYGQKVPKDITPLLPKKTKFEEQKIFWLTHEDFDFGSSYPGAKKLEEVVGCFMLVNGHIHNNKPKKKLGKMVAHNPGNISRLTVDCKNQEPSVWEWNKEANEDLLKIVLEYEKDIFNESDLVISATETVEDLKSTEETKSAFFNLLAEQTKTLNVRKTDDGTYIKESINALAAATMLKEELKDEIMSMLDEVLPEIK